MIPSRPDRPAIERIPAPAPEVFAREHLRRDRPVILTGALAGSPLLSLTPEVLIRRAGGTEVPLLCSPDGVSAHLPGGGPRFTATKTKFRLAADLIRGATPEGPKYYVMQQPTATLPLLGPDVVPPPLIAGLTLISTNLWFGSAGVVTPLHFDLAGNLLCHVLGRKRVLLFHPDDTPCLYPVAERHDHRSPVDPEQPDLERFPGFAAARTQIVDLEPGDALYLPPMWWHHVRSLDVAISVNYWWQPRFSQFLTPNGLGALREAFPPHRTWTVERLCDTSEFSGLGAMASAALAAGHPWLAALLAGEAIERAPHPPPLDRLSTAALAQARAARFAGNLAPSQVTGLVDAALALEPSDTPPR